MKRNYVLPRLSVNAFDSENIVTLSGSITDGVEMTRSAMNNSDIDLIEVAPLVDFSE